MSSKFRLFTELEVKCQVQSQVESCCYLRGGAVFLCCLDTLGSSLFHFQASGKAPGAKPGTSVR